jgi:hypothetical protein
VPPEIELVAQALLTEQRREPLRRLERARRVLPLPLAADEHQRDARPQPLEVVALQVLHVVDRVVEVDGVAALAPADDGDVVDAAHADREWEEVGALEGEVRSVVCAEAGAARHDLAAAVLVDERRDDFADPPLVVGVAARALLERHVVGAPRPLVRAVCAVDLHATVADQSAERVDHPRVLPVPALAELGGEDEQRPPPVAVREHPRGPELQVAPRHVHARSSSSARLGWSESRQEIQLCASRFQYVCTSQPRRCSASTERPVVVEVLLGGAARHRR